MIGNDSDRLGVRDESLLGSTLARPQQLHANGDPPPDPADLAASLAFGLARKHPFVDGTRRTAAVACETFIVLNGSELHADDLALYPIYLALAEGTQLEAEFAAWLRQHLAPRADGAVNEPQSTRCFAIAAFRRFDTVNGIRIPAVAQRRKISGVASSRCLQSFTLWGRIQPTPARAATVTFGADAAFCTQLVEHTLDTRGRHFGEAPAQKRDLEAVG